MAKRLVIWYQQVSIFPIKNNNFTKKNLWCCSLMQRCLITTKFCTSLDSIAVEACANFCGDMILMFEVIGKYVFASYGQRFWKPLWNRPKTFMWQCLTNENSKLSQNLHYYITSGFFLSLTHCLLKWWTSSPMKNFHILIQIGLNFILKGPSQQASKKMPFYRPLVLIWCQAITQTNADPSKIMYICH